MKIEKIVEKKIKACKTPGELVWVLDHLADADAGLAENYYLASSYKDFADYLDFNNYEFSDVINAFKNKDRVIRTLTLDNDAKILIYDVDSDMCDGFTIFLLNDHQDFEDAKKALLEDIDQYYWNWDDLDDDIFDD